MPLNGSGSYSLPSPAFPAVPNTLIQASAFNTVMNDLAGALSQCVFRDGQAAFSGPQSMGNQKLTSLAAGTADTDAVNKGQLLTLFPIGAIYLTAGNTNPGTFLGGTWVQIAQGRTLIGVGTLGSDTYTAGATGGTARVTLSTSEMPSHSHGGATGGQSNDHTHAIYDPGHAHPIPTVYSALLNPGSTAVYVMTTATFNTLTASTTTGIGTYGASANHTHSISAEGGGGAHENRMPYLAVYFWQRTA